MTTLFARKALLPGGWESNVRIEIAEGRIKSAWGDEKPGRDDVPVDVVIPGMVNVHGHAFQRALAGRTEQRPAQGNDNFWTWRERMYELAERVTPDGLRAIATQAYSEMLVAGYTTAVEFHYLHKLANESATSDAMLNALLDAAEASGIRLCYVPVLYERSGFGESLPTKRQRDFVLSLEAFLEHHDRAMSLVGEAASVGIGVHSLRAASELSVNEIANLANQLGLPMHLHIAEQQAEVEACLAAHGKRPVQWLLDNIEVTENWCLVHATHVDDQELEALAASGAVAGLCPSTEANLGDGLFRLNDYLRLGGNIAIGSDSHVSINAFEELRWLEYGQRLQRQQRNLSTFRHDHTGREIFERALEGGGQASGQALIGLQATAPADLLVLNSDDPMLAGHTESTLLDALVFGGFRLPIERVMVNGVWVVEYGDVLGAETFRSDFAQVMQSMELSA